LAEDILSYETIFDQVGLSDLLDTMYIQTFDLTQPMVSKLYRDIENFLKLPLYKDTNIHNPKDLKFLKSDPEFQRGLRKSVLELKKELLSRENIILEYLEKNESSKKISLEDILKEVDFDRASLLLLLDDFKHRLKIYDYNGREVTLN